MIWSSLPKKTKKILAFLWTSNCAPLIFANHCRVALVCRCSFSAGNLKSARLTVTRSAESEWPPFAAGRPNVKHVSGFKIGNTTLRQSKYRDGNSDHAQTSCFRWCFAVVGLQMQLVPASLNGFRVATRHLQVVLRIVSQPCYLVPVCRARFRNSCVCLTVACIQKPRLHRDSG